MFGWFRKKGTPADDDLDVNRATEFFRRGDFQESLRRAEVILVAGPHIALSWRFKGECLFSLQRYADALDCFDKATSLGGPGTEDMFLWKSLSLYNGGQPDKAKQVIRDFLESGAGSPQLTAQARAALSKLDAMG